MVFFYRVILALNPLVPAVVQHLHGAVLFKSNWGHRHRKIIKWLCFSESNINKLGLGMTMIFLLKKHACFVLNLSFAWESLLDLS